MVVVTVVKRNEEIPRAHFGKKEEICMEKMTLVEALDRRKILHKRIYNRIERAQFVEWHKHNQPGTSEKNQNVAEFEANARKEYQGIQE